MILTRTFGNVCSTMCVTMISRKVPKSKPQFVLPILSFCKQRLGESRRTIADASAGKQDLLVDYLDGDNSGVVVLGLNRPEVRKININHVNNESLNVSGSCTIT